MADYFRIVSRAISGLQPNVLESRRAVYERARRSLSEQLRSMEPPLSDLSIQAEMLALETAIRRIERELARASPSAAPSPASAQDDVQPDAAPARRRQPTARVLWSLIGAALLASALAAAYAYWTQPGAGDLQAQRDRVAAGGKQADVSRQPASAPQAEQGPGLSYIFRRQPIYYRTTHPVGTIVIDKDQRFLYLVRPNTVALRYGLGVGSDCRRLSGLFRITRKEDWSRVRTPQRPGTAGDRAVGSAGGRLLFFGANTERIHGAEAVKLIGQLMPTGCFGLWEADLADLYDRVALEARMIVAN